MLKMTSEQWAEDFYREQMRTLQELGVLTEEDVEPLARELLEQAGRSIQSCLDLGASTGHVGQALAKSVQQVTTIELVPELVEKAKEHNPQNIRALTGSFYDLDLKEAFDLITYLDGFGLGNDDEQLLLLNRIKNWVADQGVALIDIYNPDYWQKVKGQAMNFSEIKRVYDYENSTNCMIDRWTYPDGKTYQQTLKCYTPDQIFELCRKAELHVLAYFPNGRMDYERICYIETASLSDCMSYRIKIVK
ncbi:class I SAM-dependent methyltransferase [Facklamia lactis]|uniref:class I SAM-dependent methyltransferase n=1 Tax=Facklamia lactis TaxID=2749967 RepID=UPI0018CE4CDA|nr:class I SAM-dependent methyltransferase [Facklamia lactis]MBG9981208.1 class I SAM-dependent methyltransferase [Facklamia lactis]